MIVAQIVNVGFGLGSILGLLYVFGSLGYLYISIFQIIKTIRSKRDTELVFRIIQLILAPSILFLSGSILFFHGWRLDPVLMSKELLTAILLVYLILLDWKRFNRSTLQ